MYKCTRGVTHCVHNIAFSANFMSSERIWPIQPILQGHSLTDHNIISQSILLFERVYIWFEINLWNLLQTHLLPECYELCCTEMERCHTTSKGKTREQTCEQNASLHASMHASEKAQPNPLSPLPLQTSV